MTSGGGQGTLLPSFQRGDWYLSRDRLALDCGDELCLTPELDVVAELLQSPTGVDGWSDRHRRAEVLNRAADLFANAPLLIGQRREAVDDFERRVERAHGIPPTISRKWAGELAAIVQRLTQLVPVDVPASHFISLPANTFLCLEAVYRALWTGRRVFLRPSQREPWSALRLVAALIAAGVPQQQVTLVNVTHGGLPRLIRFFDEVILFGGQAVAGLQHSLPAHVTVKGPGCSVGLVTGQWSEASVMAAARLVTMSGGRLCTNLRWIVTTERAAEFAAALAQVLIANLQLGNAAWDFCRVVDSRSARLNYLRLAQGLAVGDRCFTPNNPDQPLSSGDWLPPFVAYAENAAGHQLLLTEPLLPMAVVTQGAQEDLQSTFAHSAFAYAIDAQGQVTRLRSEGVAIAREAAA